MTGAFFLGSLLIEPRTRQGLIGPSVVRMVVKKNFAKGGLGHAIATWDDHALAVKVSKTFT